MLTFPSARFVIRPLVVALGLFAAGCNSSNPVAPTASGSGAPTSSSAEVATVSQVLPASLPPSETPQTIRVEGDNFQPGLTVELTFTPDDGAAPAGRRSIRGEPKTIIGTEIRNLTRNSFEVLVRMREAGRYRLCVRNPEAPPSEPVIVAAEEKPAETSTPSISELSPASPTAGSETQMLNVYGHDFLSGLTVKIAGPGDGSRTIAGDAIQNVTSTSFRLSVVLADAGSLSLRVVNPSGQSSEPKSFTVLPSDTGGPVITGLSPQSPTKNPASQTLSVTGGNFEEGLSLILTGPGTATRTIDWPAIEDATPTSFHFSVVLAEAGGYSLRVVNPGGQTSAPRTFTVKGAEGSPSGAPTVTAVDPGSPTQSNTAKPLYVLGTNFQPGLVVKLTKPHDGGTVTIGESAITFGSSTAFQMMVTLSDAGGYSLRVVNPSGQMSEPKTFTVNAADAPAPSVSEIEPESPTKSSSSQTLHIDGHNFVAGLSVKITKSGGDTMTRSGSAIHELTSTSFQVSVVLNVVGSYSLRVVNPSGQMSEPRTFTVHAPETPPTPTVTGILPEVIHASGETRPIYATGTNFQSGLVVKLMRPGGSVQTFSGSAVNVGSSTTLQVMVQLGDPGTYKLRVVNPSEQMSDWRTFTVTGAE